jgi:hypothetical protein
LVPAGDVALPIVERRPNDIVVAKAPDAVPPPSPATPNVASALVCHSSAPRALH